MNITESEKPILKPAISIVQKVKSEYKLVSEFIRTKGLNIYGYNPISEELSKIDIKVTEELYIFRDSLTNKLTYKDSGTVSCKLNPEFIYFEALNLYSANKRVHKYNNGKLKDLCNLKPKDPYGLLTDLINKK